MTLDFESDGDASTTIQLAAKHTSSGSSKIIGFDNVVIQLNGSTAITRPSSTGSVAGALYDISGRRITTKSPQKGLYIKGNRKVMY